MFCGSLGGLVAKDVVSVEMSFRLDCLFLSCGHVRVLLLFIFVAVDSFIFDAVDPFIVVRWAVAASRLALAIFFLWWDFVFEVVTNMKMIARVLIDGRFAMRKVSFTTCSFGNLWWCFVIVVPDRSHYYCKVQEKTWERLLQDSRLINMQRWTSYN